MAATRSLASAAQSLPTVLILAEYLNMVYPQSKSSLHSCPKKSMFDDSF